MAKILIIEDDPDIADYMSTLLMRLGHPAIVANTICQGRELLESAPDIALAILDNNIGEEAAGLSFLSSIRKVPKWRTLPVIICSGNTNPDAVATFVSLKICSFIKKPFRNERFTNEVEHVLHSA